MEIRALNCLEIEEGTYVNKETKAIFTLLNKKFMMGNYEGRAASCSVYDIQVGDKVIETQVMIPNIKKKLVKLETTKVTWAIDDEDGSSYPIGKKVKHNDRDWEVIDRKFVSVGNTYSEYEYTLAEILPEKKSRKPKNDISKSKSL